MFSKKILIRVLLNTLLGLVLIFVWLRFVNLEEITKTLSKVSPVSLIPIFFFFLMSNAVRSLRLKIFISKIRKIKYVDLLFINGVANMLNFLIPIRAGEIAKGVYISQNYNIPLAKSLIWIFLDRFVDFVVVFIAAAFVLGIVPTSLGVNFILVSVLIAALLLFMAYLMVYKQGYAQKLFDFLEIFLILKPLKKLFNRFTAFFLESFQVFKRPVKDLFLIFGVSVLGYFSDAGIWVFSFKAIGVDQDFLKMFLAQLLSALTYLIPAAPGYVGSAEASGLLIFSGIFGIDTNIASSMTVLFHIVAVIYFMVFGIFSLYMIKFDLGAVWKKLKSGSSE